MLKNILANVIGRFWSILSSYLFIPLYIKFLGIENYAIISFSLVLIGFSSLLDAGMTATLSREFADSNNSSSNKLKTLKTLEVVYWGISLLLIFFFSIGANFIAANFIKTDVVDTTNIVQSIKVLGIGIALQMLINFYAGGLIGLEKQVKANLIQVLWGFFRNGIVVFIIWAYPSILYFFSWQVFVSFIFTLIARQSLITVLGSNTPSVSSRFLFDIDILNKTKKFAGGMFLIAIVAAINTQLDKLVISKLLPIQELGYYTLAISLTQGLLTLITPINSASLPRFTALFSKDLKTEGSELFLKIFSIGTLIIASLVPLLLFYGYSIVHIWTDSKELALHACLFLPYLSIGTGFLAILTIPFNIAIAHGYTKYNNYIGFFSLIFTIPAYWFAINAYGALGAAISWMVLQLVITIIYIPLVVRKFLCNVSILNLFLNRIIYPSVIASTLIFLASLTISLPNNRFLAICIIGIIGLTTFIITGLTTLPKNIYELYLQNIINKFKSSISGRK